MSGWSCGKKLRGGFVTEKLPICGCKTSSHSVLQLLLLSLAGLLTSLPDSKVMLTASQPHSEHRFLSPSSREGCRKPVLAVCVATWLTELLFLLDERVTPLGIRCKHSSTRPAGGCFRFLFDAEVPATWFENVSVSFVRFGLNSWGLHEPWQRARSTCSCIETRTVLCTGL